MSMFSLLSSLAIKAILLSGLLDPVSPSRVRMFQVATLEIHITYAVLIEMWCNPLDAVFQTGLERAEYV